MSSSRMWASWAACHENGLMRASFADLSIQDIHCKAASRKCGRTVLVKHMDTGAAGHCQSLLCQLALVMPGQKASSGIMCCTSDVALIRSQCSTTNQIKSARIQGEWQAAGASQPPSQSTRQGL